jgi:pimeloyl-ACP methyl ester carboxylesterase
MPKRIINRLLFRSYCLCIFIFSFCCAVAQQIVYPYPVQTISLSIEDTVVPMAYMDVSPVDHPNGKTIVLLHGKNFTGYYWKEVIRSFSEKGYRVIAPDQLGWGRSGKPVIHYSFHTLAANTAHLLDSLKIEKIIVVGHSIGGMLASRFAMQYPWRVEKLILENPIGLEDYKRFVPYRSVHELTAKELSANYRSYKKYQQSYYPVWKPEYDQYVDIQAESLSDPDFNIIARINALTYQMIYEQPVCYEWDRIIAPTLLIIGQEDRTVVGKDLLAEEQKKLYGQYPELGKKTQALIRKCKLVTLPGIGHIPHVQDLDTFMKEVLFFLN